MTKIFSAPLQGYTDRTWRNAHAATFTGNVDRYYAPFLRIEKGAFRNRDLRDIDPDGNRDYNFVPQVIASPAEQFAKLIAKVSEMGYTEIDINMGCPFPPVTKRHCGAGILPYPDEAAEMLTCLEQYPDIRFSVKMRLGMNSTDEWRAMMPVIAGINPIHVTMHPRTASQQYGGEIDMQQFGEFYNNAPFPVVYNGDITTTATIDTLSQQYPRLKAIMVGRGLLINPSLSAHSDVIDDTQLFKIKELHETLVRQYSAALCGEAHLLAKLKSLWEYFLMGYGDRKCRKKILKSGSMGNYMAAVEAFWLSIDTTGRIPGSDE